MKHQHLIYCALSSFLLVAGCASHPAQEKPIQQRGWIGGHYERAKRERTFSEVLFGADNTFYTFPPALAKTRDAAIFTRSLGSNTPAYLAGLREGDLVLELGHQPVTNLSGFWRIVTASQPGASLAVKAFRDGKMIDCNVTVGREKYQDEGVFSIVLPGFIEGLHPVPTQEAPWFSLGPIGYEKLGDSQTEFASAKEQYKRACHPKDKLEGHDANWRWWLAIMEVRKGKKILAQEPVAALAATK